MSSQDNLKLVTLILNLVLPFWKVSLMEGLLPVTCAPDWWTAEAPRTGIITPLVGWPFPRSAMLRPPARSKDAQKQNY